MKAELPEYLVDTPEQLAECCAHLSAGRVFGFDTEFIGEHSYHPELCLVQVATPERLFLIDPFAVGPLDTFWQLVIDPARTVVVHAGREEVRMCRFGGGQAPGNFFDLQVAAGLIGLNYPIGHGPLIQQLLGTRLAKGETLTDWRHRPLTPAQVRYAFDDVRYLLALWERLSARLAERGRTDWAREEFDALVRRALREDPAVAKWRKLRGISGLDRRRLAIVRELYAWREETAARLNRPLRVVLRDDLIVEVARRNPRHPEDLHVLRGLPKGDLGPLCAAVERARQLPPEEWPEPADRDDDPPQVALVVGVLMAVLGDFCQREALATSLVATNQDLRALVRARLRGGEAPPTALTLGWRAAHVLPHLTALLDGRRALHVADIRRPTPFGFADRPDGGPAVT